MARTVGAITDLYGGYAEAGELVCMPEADTSGEEDSLIRCELFDDIVHVCTRKI